MSEIKTFPFDKEKFDLIKGYEFGRNWPVVYLIEDGKELYVGETINLLNRSRQHHDLPERQRLTNIHIITDEEFNKSAALDIESWLIQYMSADGAFKLQNGNAGLQNHNYFDRERYEAKFEVAWESLKKTSLVKQDLVQIKNSDLFKYSPYKTLTEDQLSVVERLFDSIKSRPNNTFLINGTPGTGKTVLATFLVKYLKEKEETKNLEVGLVFPMTSIRGTVKKVFKNIKGLSAGMVIGPNDVVKKKYDLIIVDEAHRLQRRKNIMGMGAYDKVNQKLGLGKEGTQLDWILKSSEHQIFLYDRNQSVRPSDIRPGDFEKVEADRFDLTTQQRVEGGNEYIKFIENLFDFNDPPETAFSNYDFRIYDDISEMVVDVKNRNKEYGLSRVVAGYAWEWRTKDGSGNYDIQIGETKLKWNSTTKNWVNSENAINEVGCIHTIQGYDLNHVGVIIGPELSYDPENNKFVIDRDKYADKKGHMGVSDPEELERYIINIYKTLLTRGIKGAYVYIVDENLRNYFKKQFKTQTGKRRELKEHYDERQVISPYIKEMAMIPLVGSAPCGEPLLGEENIEEYVEVEKSKIKLGVKYFIVRADGDSMNKAGINDKDLILCRYSEKGETGDKVVALLGGENVTIKYYDKKDGRRVLLPKSTNPKHRPIIPEEGDIVQGIVQEVLRKNKNE